ncbi:hypothetical protein [Flavobacterium sp. HNIBRBA15423]|uniref:hypothetical protein n=1 Tax=Flavobacterium sp. HNIBRBA15423 TaxID=3458683 RepID=UPI0040445083
MSYEFKLVNRVHNNGYYDVFFNKKKIEIEADNYELLIKHKKYCFIGYSEVYDFEEDKVIAVNMWDCIIFFSTIDGEILYYSGLKETFVGLESLESDYLVITDNSLFLINKKECYPWGFKIVTDSIIDYHLKKDQYEIILKLDTDTEQIVKLNFI